MQKITKKKVEFTVKLKDRYGNEKKLTGLVEEGITRNEALAKLVKENGGICEIKEGEGELKGLNWITRIEFKDGFKIEEWGQYATAEGEFEIGKVKRSLTEKLMGVFFKKFRTTSFWENGDTKRVTKDDNFIVFREDYGVTAELPSPDILLKDLKVGGGCGGKLKEGEIELVKLAAKIDIKREVFLVDFENCRVEKRKIQNGTYSLNEIFTPKRYCNFDIPQSFSNNEFKIFRIEEIKNSAHKNFENQFISIKRVGENNSDIKYTTEWHDEDIAKPLEDKESKEIEKFEVAPNLFFNKYQNEIVKNEEKKEDEETKTERAEEKEENSEEKNEEKKVEKKKEGYQLNKQNVEEEKKVQSEEKNKIISILNKLRDESKEERKKNEEKKVEVIEKPKETKKIMKKEKKEKKKVEKRIETKKEEKKELVKMEKNFKQKKERKNENKEKKHEASVVKYKAKTKKKEKKEKKQPKKDNKKNRKKMLIKKIKINIKIPKTKEIKKPKIKNIKKHLKKGVQIAHKIYLAALKKIETKKKKKKKLLKKLMGEKPGNKIKQKSK